MVVGILADPLLNSLLPCFELLQEFVRERLLKYFFRPAGAPAENLLINSVALTKKIDKLLTLQVTILTRTRETKERRS